MDWQAPRHRIRSIHHRRKSVEEKDMPNTIQINGHEYTEYRRKQIAHLRPWQEGDDMEGVSVSAPDTESGSPKAGDMIAVNIKNPADRWLVAAQYFSDNFDIV